MYASKKFCAKFLKLKAQNLCASFIRLNLFFILSLRSFKVLQRLERDLYRARRKNEISRRSLSESRSPYMKLETLN